MKATIEKIIEENKDNAFIDLKNINNSGDVLINLFQLNQFDLFHELLKSYSKGEIELFQEMLIIFICSNQIIENQILEFFETIISKGIENEIIIRNIQIGSYKTPNGKQQHVQLLKLFHRSFNKCLQHSQIFHSHFDQISTILSSSSNNTFSQTQKYPIVNIKGTCLICKNSLFDGQPVTIYPCGHGIHSACSDYLNDTSIVCRCCVALSSVPLLKN